MAMTSTQAHKFKREIGAEVVESSTNMLGQSVWLFYSADGRKLATKLAK
jgi:hypothetical protein